MGDKRYTLKNNYLWCEFNCQEQTMHRPENSGFVTAKKQPEKTGFVTMTTQYNSLMVEI